MAGVDVVDLLSESHEHFSEYLRSYTKASVALLNRWPAFVPEQDRYADTLEQGTAAAKRVFAVASAEEVASEEESKRGLRVSGVGQPRGDGPPGPQPPTPVNASASTKVRKGEGRRPSSQGATSVDAPSVGEEAMREKLERLNGKLRHEVSERTKANDESMRRGMQLQASKRDNAALQETVRRQAQQLEHAREVTLKLEAQHREYVAQVESADVRLVKERKLRHTWQLRAEKYERRIRPLEEEAKVLKESLSITVELLEKAQASGSVASGQVTELSATKNRLEKVTNDSLKQAHVAREEKAHAGLQLSLMADRRDELLETIDGLQKEAETTREALEAMEAARNEAADLAQEERRLRALAEAASRKAADATAEAAKERSSWRERAEALEAEVGTQREHVQALLTQDAIRESEQRKLFDAVSELLARVQYLGDLPPEKMGMSRAEALQHRDEAMRHLRALREAHALSTFPPQLVLSKGAVTAGASMLNAQAAGTLRRGGGGGGGGGDGGGSSAPSPRGGRRAPGGGGGGGAVLPEAMPTPSEDAHAALSPRVRAQAAVQGGYTAAPLDATSGSLKGGALTARPRLEGNGFESWRASLDHAEAMPSSAKASPRGRRAKADDPARVAPPKKEPAAEWEKAKLLELMSDKY